MYHATMRCSALRRAGGNVKHVTLGQAHNDVKGTMLLVNWNLGKLMLALATFRNTTKTDFVYVHTSAYS